MNDPWEIEGLDPKTGALAVPPLQAADLAALARGRPEDAPNAEALFAFAAPWLRGTEEEPDPEELSVQDQKALRRRRQSATNPTLGIRDGFDATALRSAGWGIVFAEDDPQADAIREALAPLIEHRQQEASQDNPARFRELRYKPGTTKATWITQQGSAPGPVDPDRLPYHLLLVGDPARISWRFQSQLGVQHGVGRLGFTDPADYAAYARAVLDAERDGIGKSGRELLFLCPETDQATIRAGANLHEPLRARATKLGWTHTSVAREEATPGRLATRLRDAPPRLWISSSHGAAGRTLSDASDRRLQGALVLREDAQGTHFGGDLLGPDMDLRGTMALHTACFGAGTPRLDSFAQAVTRNKTRARDTDAQVDQLAWLAERSLARGALAVIGHVDRTCSTSWRSWAGALQTANVGHFEDLLGRLLRGAPVGWALDPFGDWFAEKDSALRDLLEAEEQGEEVSDEELGYAWLSAKDAGGWVILGDPATRLAT